MKNSQALTHEGTFNNRWKGYLVGFTLLSSTSEEEIIPSKFGYMYSERKLKQLSPVPALLACVRSSMSIRGLQWKDPRAS